MIQAKATAYQPPSSTTGATELDALERYSEVVPDVMLSQALQTIEKSKAATSSRGVIAGIMANPTGTGRYKFAIEQARYYKKDSGISGPELTALQVDKALVNVGGLMLESISGRVSTEIDARLAHDTDKLVARGRQIVALYSEDGISKDRLVIRMPATWEAIQAAQTLENEGVATHLVCIFSFVQAVAAAQAGVSVIQINAGRLADWYDRNPGMLRDPNAPLEARAMEMAGYGAAQANPGLLLAEKVFAYLKTNNPKTKLMASGLRTKQEALALAGCDYLVVGPRVLQGLQSASTLEGYNDGLHVSESQGMKPKLTAEFAKNYEISSVETGEVSKAIFEDQLGLAGKELLNESVQSMVLDANRLEPLFLNQAGGQE